MITDTLKAVLQDEGIVAIVTQGKDAPHVVNTWNSYITLTKEGHLFIPVGGMQATEENLHANNHISITIGSRNVQGLHYMGTGFLIEGTALIEKDGNPFQQIKEKFEWARAVLVIKPDKITQTL